MVVSAFTRIFSDSLQTICNLTMSATNEEYECPETYTMMYMITHMLRLEIIFELGVCLGYSTLVLLKAMEHNKKGVMYSIDAKPPLLPDEEFACAVPADMKAKLNIVMLFGSILWVMLGSLLQDCKVPYWLISL